MSVEYLLLPLTDGGPCGVPLLHEPEYDAIAAARHEDDPSLPRGVWTSELKRADWPEVVRLCEQALTGRSKDLQVAAWLGEAWIARDGLAGGVRATRLLQGLCERFWERLHPLPRGADMEFRTAPFEWADAQWSSTLMLQVPIVSGGGVDACAFTLARWREDCVLNNEERKSKKASTGAAKDGGMPEERFLKQLTNGPLSELAAHLAVARQWDIELKQLHIIVEQRVPNSAIHFRGLVENLVQITDLLRRGEKQHPDYLEASAERRDERSAAPALANSATVPESGPLKDSIDGREDAYRRLSLIADYLAKADPHSPVPSLIRRAIAWGRMPFEELLTELTSNNNEMQKLLVRGPPG